MTSSTCDETTNDDGRPRLFKQRSCAAAVRRALAGSCRPEAAALPVLAAALALSGTVVAQEQEQGTSEEPEYPDALEEIVVSSRRFLYNDAFGATKMGLAVADTPQTIVVLTDDLMDVANMRSFEDFYKLDASGGTSQAIDGFPRNYYRGFWQQGIHAIRVDGFRMPADINLDLAAFERIEVIKGATSTVYGQNSVAGTLNAVSKQPSTTFGGHISADAGSYSSYRVEADVTGPIAGSDALAYRLVTAYDDSDSFLDFAYSRSLMVTPSISYEPNESTRITARAIYQEVDASYHFASLLQLRGNGTGDVFERLYSEGLQIPDIPRERFFGMPWNHADKQETFVQLQGEHDFSSDWTLRVNSQYNLFEYDADAFWTQAPYDENGFAYYTSVYGDVVENSMFGAEVNLFGDVDLFGRSHTLFVGADYARLEGDARGGDTTMSFGWENSAFNVFTPDYNSIPVHDEITDYTYFYDEEEHNTLFGGTVQLLLRPTDRLNVLLGGRFSRDTVDIRFRGGLTTDIVAGTLPPWQTTGEVEFSEFTMQTGVTYEITDRFNVYASYGETFEPSFDLAFDPESPEGKLIDPEEGRAYEVGVKGNLTEDLSITAAAFQMERTNIAQQDLQHPGFSVPLGTLRSRGLELGLQGRVTPEFNLYASLAFMDAEFSEGEFEGLQPRNAPKFGASVFGTYELLDGPWHGLGFGFGVVHKQGLETFASFYTSVSGEPLTFDFGSFTEVDGRIFYNVGEWTYEVAVTNLLDEKYYSPSFNYLSFATHVNPPRMLHARIRYDF